MKKSVLLMRALKLKGKSETMHKKKHVLEPQKSQQSLASIAVFSLGQYGYDVAFRSAVESQRAYCEMHGYKYFCISEPGSDLLGRENIWLKTLALYGALMNNDYVLYLDSDVKINADCPPLDTAVTYESPIGLVAGHSGRANAGVIIAKRCKESIDFFAEWVSCLGKPISPKHDVGWGENGHLIRLVEKYDVKLLDTKWNNTYDSSLDDYMRHYTGPLRSEFVFEGESREAWDKICEAVKISKSSSEIDIMRTFAELKKVYIRSLPNDIFASFDSCWEQLRDIVLPFNDSGFYKHSRAFKKLLLVENVSESSQNAYVRTLKDGLDKVIGKKRVTTGIDSFWNYNFTKGDIVHIEWLESLFQWKVPTDEQVTHFVNRMEEISRTSAILYTAHNFDLMPTYAASRRILMQAIADHSSLICHLSEANIEPYIRHHSSIKNLGLVPVSIVPHGDYQPYFRSAVSHFEDEALKSEKIKVLVFGHIRTERELNFCLDVGKELGSTDFQMIFAGVIHPDILHWKEIHKLNDNWDGGVRRMHIKIHDDKVVSLIEQSDCLLIPRFERLNSGVQFLAYTMSKPAFVPSQNSMEEVQNTAVGHGTYSPNDPKSAASVIRNHYSDSKALQLKKMFKTFLFNYNFQDVYEVGKAHEKAYEKAVSYHLQKK
jgi:hypothetical protein